jgi:prepilin-type N-terminal cleavage/methylation domain-containing protein
MTDDGFTLAEMLVALVMVGLAASGLALAAHQVTQAETRVQDVRRNGHDLARLQASLGEALRSAGPFLAGGASPAQLDGDGRTLSFTCEGEAACQLGLLTEGKRTVAVFRRAGAAQTAPLAGLKAPALRYVSAVDGRVTGQWPAMDRADRLSAVVLADGERPVAVYPLAVEQSARCVFDARTRGCAAEAAL